MGELPRGVGPLEVLGGAALTGIGFTVSLLIVDLARHGTPTFFIGDRLHHGPYDAAALEARPIEAGRPPGGAC